MHKIGSILLVSLLLLGCSISAAPSANNPVYFYNPVRPSQAFDTNPRVVVDLTGDDPVTSCPLFRGNFSGSFTPGGANTQFLLGDGSFKNFSADYTWAGLHTWTASNASPLVTVNNANGSGITASSVSAVGVVAAGSTAGVSASSAATLGLGVYGNGTGTNAIGVRGASNSGDIFQGQKASAVNVFRVTNAGDIRTSATVSAAGIIQGGGYKSADASAGISYTATLVGLTSLTFKDGLLVSHVP